MFIPPGFRQHSVPTSLGTIAYYTNDGEPWASTEGARSGKTLIFLHGLGGGSSAYEWSKVYPAFAADYRIIAPDLIGWGRSDHPERNYRPEDYITTIIEFLDKTCDGATPVIASALTAAFTVRAAIDRPDLFKLLILTTAAGLAEAGDQYRNNFFTQLASTPIVDRFLYSTGVATGLGIRSYLEQRQFTHAERVYPELVEAYLQSAQQPNAEYAALSFVRGDLCFDLTQYIKQLTIPTAIIWGRESEFTSPDVGRRLADLNPDAVRYFYQSDDFGFTPQLELPALAIGLIRKYMMLLEDA